MARRVTSFEIANIGSTIFTITKPGGTQDRILPQESIAYNPQGVYSAVVSGVQTFTINFSAGNLDISKGVGIAPGGTSATVRSFMN